jgi:hypothetical protein
MLEANETLSRSSAISDNILIRGTAMPSVGKHTPEVQNDSLTCSFPQFVLSDSRSFAPFAGRQDNFSKGNCPPITQMGANEYSSLSTDDMVVPRMEEAANKCNSGLYDRTLHVYCGKVSSLRWLRVKR